MEEPGGLQSMWSLRVGHDWATSRSLFPFMHWSRKWHPTPVFLPGKSHGQRSLVGCSPWGREESDQTAQLPFHFSLSCIGKGNGNPLQCSCLENPRDGGAWWAAVYGVAQSGTWLKWLSTALEAPTFFILSLKKIIMYLLATLGLHCCAWAFFSCRSWASHCGGFSCWRTQVLGCVGFRSCIAQA